MNNNCISVKSKNAAFITKGIMWLLLMVFAMICAFMPVFAGIEGGGATALRIVGWAVFAVAAAVFIVLLVRELHPCDAIVLDSRGFKENQHIDGTEVEWTNVASVGIYGTKKSPLFGITLENNDIVIDKLRKRAADEMRDNIEENLPSILIPQGEVRMSLRELRDLFNRFIREARTLEDNNAVHKQKVNPFTTEDVLRAFGQLPPKEKTEEEKSEGSTATKVLDDAPAEESDDDFYTSLRMKVGEKAAEEAEKAGNHTEAAEDQIGPAADGEEMPDEMKEILAKVKSRKISEIEKMLADKDIPYSAIRELEQKAAAETAAAAAVAEQTAEETAADATKVFEPVKPAAPIKGISDRPDEPEETESNYYDTEEDADAEDDDGINAQTVIFDNTAGGDDEIFVDDQFSRKTGKETDKHKKPGELNLPPVSTDTVSGDEIPGIIIINDD